ncbi:MAG: flavodoxin family protein, partial [Dehalococcoidia bacterium]|nr:flavodoxin family protein [Dehalococcoidia bacterium]
GIIGFWPFIFQDIYRQKVLRILSLLMKDRGVSEASRSLVIEAARLASSNYFDPVIHMAEDWEKFKLLTTQPYHDREAYYKVPVVVKRWPPVRLPPVKSPAQTRVVAFCASPRKSGNTEVLIKEALRGAEEAGAKTTEYIFLQSLKIGYCTGCRRCKEPDYQGVCAVKDEMSEIYQKIFDADAIIIGFPIYTGRECGQLAVFLDRWDCLARVGSRLLGPGRRALVIGTWGYPYDDTYDDVMARVMVTLRLHRIETVEAISAGGFAGMLHGLDDDRRALVLRHPEQLRKAYEAGRALVLGSQT